MSFYAFMPTLLNMSLTASVAIVLVILLRLLLKKAPKVISYALWAVVLFRLLCPVSIDSSFSLYNLFDAPTEESGTMTSVIEYVPSNIVHTEYPSVALPVPGISDAINETLPQGEEQLRADPLEGPIFIATYVWMAGVLAMVIYSIVSYIRLRGKLSIVVPLRDNIFIADDIKSPFVVGLFRPKIYLPCNLGDKEQEYIILHEQHHIKRLDHVMKALAFLALAIHWFNPLVWVAFILSGKDMEMSCDEAVVRKLGTQIRADYTASLLSLATGKRIIAGMPLAFGEGNTKDRIRNLANWKKPAFWVVLLAAIACVVLAVCLLTNPITMSDHFVLTNTDSPANTNKLSYDIQLGNKVMSGQIYVEQWIDGACVKSTPVVMTQYVDSIDIVMRDRREDGTSVGTDIQIETNQYGGSLLTYFEHPQNFDVRGWGFTGYELNEKRRLMSNDEVILAAKAFDDGSGIRTFGCETLVNEPDRIKDAGYMIVVRAVFSEDPLGVTNHGEASFPTEVLTLNDVIILSQKGYDLSWADFENYDYIETGSGLYIRVYEINAIFRLMIGGGSPDSDPMYIYLALADDLDTRIDIRDGGVTEFISEYGNLAPAYHPEGILHLGLNAEIVEIDTSNHILYVKDIDESADVFGDRCAIDCNYAISRFNLLYVNYGDANDVRTIGFSDFQVGDAIIIGLYDSEKEKALNGAAVAEQIQLGTQSLSSIRALSQNEIEQVNAAFAPIVYDKQGNPISTNVWSCFFTSYYSDVRNMNFAEFLAYFPGDGSTVDEEEFAVLKEHPDFLFYGEVSALANMPVPVHRYPVRIIDLVLKEYAGITVDDLDTSEVVYLAEYDAFYNHTSDAGGGMFYCTRGEIDGDIVRLYEEFDYGTDMLTLKKVGNNYQIVAHQQVES